MNDQPTDRPTDRRTKRVVESRARDYKYTRKNFETEKDFSLKHCLISVSLSVSLITPPTPLLLLIIILEKTKQETYLYAKSIFASYLPLLVKMTEKKMYRGTIPVGLLTCYATRYRSIDTFH